MIDKIKNNISENSGLVNMAINLAILFLLFTVASGIKDIKQSVVRVEQQTVGTIQPIMDEEMFKKRMIEFFIQKLETELSKDSIKK
jgi:hypothetical protein